jgi:hypothetical protein
MVTTIKTLTVSGTMSAVTLTVPALSSPPLSTATGSQKATITTPTASKVTMTTILVIPIQISSNVVYPTGNLTMKATGSVSTSATSAVPKQSAVSAGAKGMEGWSFGASVVSLGIALVVL